MLEQIFRLLSFLALESVFAACLGIVLGYDGITSFLVGLFVAAIIGITKLLLFDK